MTTLKAFLITALSLLLPLTHAGELTLYESSGFDGRFLDVRGYTPDLSRASFNDRTASLVVHSGIWQLCTDAHFMGYCTLLTQGKYPTLSPRLKNHISSVREMCPHEGEMVECRHHDQGLLELFEEADFERDSMRIESDNDNLSRTDLAFRIASIIVHAGTWELCTETGYRGKCSIYPPGRYPHLGKGLWHNIYSARLISANDSTDGLYGTTPRTGKPGEGSPRAQKNDEIVVLFEYENFEGWEWSTRSDVTNLDDHRFNDRAQSLIVYDGKWEFCVDAHYRGHCVTYGPGRYASLSTMGDRISSVRRLDGPGSRRQRNNEEVVLFENADFEGKEFSAKSDISNLDNHRFNDRAQSLIVYEGKWQFCVDANFGGDCVVYGPGQYAELGKMDNRISSFRRLRAIR